MKTIIKILFSLFLLSCFTTSHAQKIKLAEGDLDFLKGQKELNVEYVYDNMGVGKYDREQDYIDRKVEEYNDKESGSGDKWLVSWKEDREKRFQPSFEELMNKNLEGHGLTVGSDKDQAKYTLILETVFTEPGFNVGVARKNALIDVVATFVETGNTENALAVVTIDKSPGRLGGYDFDTGVRIEEAYAKCGKELGQYLDSKVLK
jgi:hypothetical protein